VYKKEPDVTELDARRNLGNPMCQFVHLWGIKEQHLHRTKRHTAVSALEFGAHQKKNSPLGTPSRVCEIIRLDPSLHTFAISLPADSLPCCVRLLDHILNINNHHHQRWYQA